MDVSRAGQFRSHVAIYELNESNCESELNRTEPNRYSVTRVLLPSLIRMQLLLSPGSPRPDVDDLAGDRVRSTAHSGMVAHIPAVIGRVMNGWVFLRTANISGRRCQKRASRNGKAKQSRDITAAWAAKQTRECCPRMFFSAYTLDPSAHRHPKPMPFTSATNMAT